jgi:hypothetical protein
MQVLAAHYEFLQSLRHEQFGLALPAWGGALGLSLRAHYSEAIEERDALGNLLGTFGSHDLDFGLAYGRRLLPGWSMGAGAHFVRERIANSATDTYAFDAGLAWEPGVAPGLRLALAGTSLGGSPRFVIDGIPGQPVPLPAAVQGGASYGMRVAQGWALLGSVEGRLTRGRSGQALAGVELASPLGAALRAGWREGDDTADLGLGAGWRAPGWAVDYAFVPYRLDLGDTHRFSLWTQF